MSLSIPQVILLAWFGFAAITTVLSIGKGRAATTPRGAVVALVLTGVLATLVVLS